MFGGNVVTSKRVLLVVKVLVMVIGAVEFFWHGHLFEQYSRQGALRASAELTVPLNNHGSIRYISVEQQDRLDWLHHEWMGWMAVLILTEFLDRRWHGFTPKSQAARPGFGRG